LGKKTNFLKEERQIKKIKEIFETIYHAPWQFLVAYLVFGMFGTVIVPAIIIARAIAKIKKKLKPKKKN